MKKILKKIAIRIYVFVIFPVFCVAGLFGTMMLAEMICKKF